MQFDTERLNSIYERANRLNSVYEGTNRLNSVYEGANRLNSVYRELTDSVSYKTFKTVPRNTPSNIHVLLKT
jgi:2-C-methyl-D-erythritol 4-phosphate cytidylyltransferase